MLAVELHTTDLPHLQIQDTVATALQLLNDHKVGHLPVVADEKFLGLVAEKNLLDVHNKNVAVEHLQKDFIVASINENDHFLRAVNISNHYQISVIPVVNFEKELIGTISGQNLMYTLGHFSGAYEPGGIIILEMERNQFSISEINRIVESHEARVLHLNTYMHAETGLLRATIQIDKRELSSVVAGFERYEYSVVHYFGEERFENEIYSNYLHLMNYLDI